MSKATGQRTLTIAGEEYTLRFSIMAIAELEKMWNVKTINGVVARLDDPGVNDMIDLFYALTRSHHPEITRDVCEKILDDEGLEGTTDALLSSVSDGQPDDDDEEEGDENPPAKAPARKKRAPKKRH